MKIWRVHISIISSKKQPDFWENWDNIDVVAENIGEASQKAVESTNKNYKFYQIRADKTELYCEADVE
jgi:hypothetical protein